MERAGVALATFLAASWAAASAVGWALKWTPPFEPLAPAPVVGAVQPAVNPPDAAALARLLGGSPDARRPAAGDATAARLKLSGILAGRQTTSPGALALISVDGATARPYRVGSAVLDDWTLQTVTPRTAVLRLGRASDPTIASGPTLTLELPATANLPVNPPAGPGRAVAP
ncbi:MAG: general secretion pathway protein C [Rhodoferax sp.]|nr:general secretion pathway protein C [Rhodoferax sp.]